MHACNAREANTFRQIALLARGGSVSGLQPPNVIGFFENGKPNDHLMDSSGATDTFVQV